MDTNITHTAILFVATNNYYLGNGLTPLFINGAFLTDRPDPVQLQNVLSLIRSRQHTRLSVMQQVDIGCRTVWLHRRNVSIQTRHADTAGSIEDAIRADMTGQHQRIRSSFTRHQVPHRFGIPTVFGGL